MNETLTRLNSVLDALYEAIADAGTQGLPSGHLYAALMGHMTLDTYQTMIDVLVQTGRVTLSGHVLRIKTGKDAT